MENCAPLWAGALEKSKKYSEVLERVQRSACRILIPNVDSKLARKQLQISTLRDRRLSLTRKCAAKMAENPRFSHLFPLKEGPRTRRKGKYNEPTWKSNRYGFSFVPFSIRLLNGEGTNPDNTVQ